MPRHSWKEIRSTADPQTIAAAERKAEAMLDAMVRQDHTDNEPTNPVAAAEWEAFPGEKNEPRP
jgi:hypothetical protein